MHRRDTFDCFYFENETTCYQNIYPITNVEFLPVVYDRQPYLSTNWQAPLFQLISKASLIRAFEKPGAK